MTLRAWYDHLSYPIHIVANTTKLCGHKWGGPSQDSKANQQPVVFYAHVAGFVLPDLLDKKGHPRIPSFVSMVNTECEQATNALKVTYNQGVLAYNKPKTR